MEISLSVSEISGCNITLPDNLQKDVKSFIEKKLGRSITNWINCIELLYLVDKHMLKVNDPNMGNLGFAELVTIFSRINPQTWIIYEVYLDLRKRGRIVAPGPRPDTLLVKESKKSRKYKYYVIVMETKRSVPLQALLSFLEEAIKNKWEPLAAIVDSYGDITYYSMAALKLQPRASIVEAELSED